MAKTGISGSIDLLKLKGSQVIRHEEMEGIFIPFRKAKGVKKVIRQNGEAMAALNLFLFPKQDDWGNDYMVSRARTKEENENKVYSEILGNMAEIKEGKPSGTTPEPSYKNKPSNASSEESPF